MELAAVSGRLFGTSFVEIKIIFAEIGHLRKMDAVLDIVGEIDRLAGLGVRYLNGCALGTLS
jgi:hypothetical protein